MKTRFCGLWFAAIAACILAAAGTQSCALQFGPTSVVSATEIPQSALILPDQLNAVMQQAPGKRPLVLQVGSRMMFDQGHIPSSEYAGPAVQPAGLDLLRNRVVNLPRGKFIVIYCGCCPWTRCPNMGTAYRLLQSMGFTNVKVLYLPNNFGTDWVSKGYRVEK